VSLRIFIEALESIGHAGADKGSVIATLTRPRQYRYNRPIMHEPTSTKTSQP
jgi:hypothetical protein